VCHIYVAPARGKEFGVVDVALEVVALAGARYARFAQTWENEALRSSGADAACPVCGLVGAAVGLVTVRALLRKNLRDTASGDGFRYCRTPHCPIVWYRGDPSFVADAASVRVSVNVKTSDPRRPLCYCLKVDEATVFREVSEKGCCSTLEDVQRMTRANTGKACHVTNPSGNCCEREILAVIAKGLAAAGKTGKMPEFQALEGCCVRPRGLTEGAASSPGSTLRPA
jgi:hypothetical protein